MSEEPRVLAIVPQGNDACLLWRQQWPLEALRAHGFVADQAAFGGGFKKDVLPRLRSGDYNLVLTPRVGFDEPWMTDYFYYAVQQFDLAWVYETDDDLFSYEIVEHNIAYGMQLAHNDIYGADERRIRIRTQAEDGRAERTRILGLVDGVIVSTPPLAEVVGRYTRAPIFVVPNAIEPDWFNQRLARKPRRAPTPSVGWSGGFRVEADLEPLVAAWPRVGERFPEVCFVLHGFAAPALLDALSSRLPARQMRYIPWSDLDDYPSALLNLDIGCCTVADTEWNACKSSIKWYEMTLAGAAVVGSHAVYGREISDGYDGLLATTADEWEAQLARLIADQRVRQSVQQHALDTIRREHAIDTGWERWRDAFRAVLDTRARAAPTRGAVPLARAE